MKEFAYKGLSCWFTNMIPSLMPFMILTNYLITTGLSNKIIAPLYTILNPIFRVRKEVFFAIATGFLCGFPIGAKVTATLYQNGTISKQEANYLLAFANNIGPAYFICYLYPLFYKNYSLYTMLLLQYFVPLLYGLLLRYTFYRYLPQISAVSTRKQENLSHLESFDSAIQNATSQLLSLMGYMVIFNVVAGFFYMLPLPSEFTTLLHMGTEISGGIEAFHLFLNHCPRPQGIILLYLQSFLALGGLCCLFQTMKVLDGTDLSIKKYMLHKLILCSIISSIIIVLNQIQFF